MFKMSTLEKNLHINQLPLDKWSLKEKLYLISCISDFVNPDWVFISELLIKICGANQNRPLDWFSKANCASQYNQIMKNNDTTHFTESISNSKKPTTGIATFPEKIILKNLLDERVRELIAEIHIAQEEYANLFAEIKAVQSMPDDRLQQMWCDIEKELEMQRVEEMKLENQLREREKNKEDQNWNATVTKDFNCDSRQSTNTSPVDMDVEDIAVVEKSNSFRDDINSAMRINIGTSPLLCTLLKSTNTNGNYNHNTNSVRYTAPTIATLLTRGSVTNTNNPPITATNDNVKLLVRPLSGPALDTVKATPSKISPAQSAPTLSMLLERSKNLKGIPLLACKIPTDIKISKRLSTVQLDDEANFIKQKTIEKVVYTEIDDTDAIEGKQLLEVFKNIGNIAELDIHVAPVIDDGEVDFLKNVSEESVIKIHNNSTQYEVNLKNANKNKSSTNNTVITKTNSAISKIRAKIHQIQQNFTDSNAKQKESISKNINVSCNDSSDNILLAKDMSLESPKEQVHQVETMTNVVAIKDNIIARGIKSKQNEKIDTTEIKNTSSSQNSSKGVRKEIMESKNRDTQSTETMVHLHKIKEDNVSNNKTLVYNIESVKLRAIRHNKPSDDDVVQGQDNISIDPVELINDNSIFTAAITDMKSPFIVSPVDTDEDSLEPDVRKDEKHACKTKIPQCLNTRKVEDDTNQLPFPPLAVTNLASRNNNLRKLRERDGSESPMVDDDATNTSDYSTSQKLRRRYSSTPVLDSVPNSPASSDRDERELRTSKKTLLSIYNFLYSSKHASSVQKILNEVNSNGILGEICLRPMDFQIIKRNIESGVIRSINELQRDMLLMCQNILMLIETSSINYKIVQTFQKECQSIREFVTNGWDNTFKSEREKFSLTTLSTTSKSRSGSRKSLRIS